MVSNVFQSCFPLILCGAISVRHTQPCWVRIAMVSCKLSASVMVIVTVYLSGRIAVMNMDFVFSKAHRRAKQMRTVDASLRYAASPQRCMKRASLVRTGRCIVSSVTVVLLVMRVSRYICYIIYIYIVIYIYSYIYIYIVILYIYSYIVMYIIYIYIYIYICSYVHYIGIPI